MYSTVGCKYRELLRLLDVFFLEHCITHKVLMRRYFFFRLVDSWETWTKLWCITYITVLSSWERRAMISRLHALSNTQKRVLAADHISLWVLQTVINILVQACESHDHDHQWTDYAMVWLPQDKRKHENKVARLMWDFDCLHFAQYILISPHGIDCKQTWCKKIYRMDRVSWLKPLFYVTIGWHKLIKYPDVFQEMCLSFNGFQSEMFWKMSIWLPK